MASNKESGKDAPAANSGDSKFQNEKDLEPCPRGELEAGVHATEEVALPHWIKRDMFYNIIRNSMEDETNKHGRTHPELENHIEPKSDCGDCLGSGVLKCEKCHCKTCTGHGGWGGGFGDMDCGICEEGRHDDCSDSETHVIDAHDLCKCAKIVN